MSRQTTFTAYHLPTVKALLGGALGLLLAACLGGGPVVPDWQQNAHGALAAYRQSYLEGDMRVASAELTYAKRQLSRTGSATLLARAELTRCALELASLAAPRCGEADQLPALLSDAGESERAYAAFLGATPGAALPPAELLPAQYRSLVVSGESALAGIADPLSRLVAAGFLLQRQELSAAGIAQAVETAASQGWRRPLAAWLQVAEAAAQARGDEDGAAQARRRGALIDCAGC